MHELTTSEGVTILSVLARGEEVQRSELDHLGLPASTFYATRRKIYDAGWLSDRYLPDPWASGFSSVDFALVRPPLGERSRMEREWASAPDTVLLWSGLNALFGVFFRRNGHAPTDKETSSVSITATRGSVPVYFDFSLAWSRFIRGNRETGYPRSLSEPGAHKARPRTASLHELFDQDRQGENSPTRPHRWHSSSGLPRNQRHLLEWGFVQSRTFLNVEALPPYDGRILGELVFVSGRLRKGTAATDVLNTLIHDCQVSPFLLVADDETLLLLALGQIGAGASSRTKLPRATKSVSAALSHALADIETNIERADCVRKVVDHRYERLFPSPREGPTEGGLERPSGSSG